MKRIAIFTTAYLPFVGGAEVAIFELTKRLGDIHFDIYTARFDKKLPRVEKRQNVTIYRLGLGSFLDKFILAIWGGHRLAIKNHHLEPYGAIWAMMASFGALAGLSFKERYKSVPFLLTLQEGDNLQFVEWKSRLLFGRFKKIFRLTDHVQVISSYLGKWARSLGAKVPITVLPNGVDLSLFKFNHDYKANAKIIITTSRLVKKNGVGDLISALNLLPSDYKLWILGIGPLEYKLKTQISKLKLDDRILFLGQKSYSELPNYLAQASVFVRPSLTEGLGNSFLEAMAVGVPIVGTPVGGIVDFLKDGETGFFCQVNNPKSIAEQILYITDKKNEEKITQIIKKSRKLIETKYDWDVIAIQFRLLLQKLG